MRRKQIGNEKAEWNTYQSANYSNDFTYGNLWEKKFGIQLLKATKIEKKSI